MSAWLDAARRTTWIPPAFARYDLALHEAALRLRATLDVLERLLDAGLPTDGHADPRVDANDIFNLALDLRWHATLPVAGFRGALRWLRQPLPVLVDAQDWCCEFTAPPLTAGLVLAARPDPEIYGGVWQPERESLERESLERESLERESLERESLEREPPGQEPPGQECAALAPEPGRMSVTSGQTVRGVARLRGRHTPVRSALVMESVRAVLNSGHRWAKLPLELQARPDIVSSLGYATCVSISLSLSETLCAAGFQTRTRRGFLVAPVATGHSWVEVLDTDDEWKVIDPVLMLLRARLAEVESGGHTVAAGPEPNLADGLLVNRVLATALPADSPLAIGADGAAVEIAVAFRKAPPAT